MKKATKQQPQEADDTAASKVRSFFVPKEGRSIEAASLADAVKQLKKEEEGDADK